LRSGTARLAGFWSTYWKIRWSTW